MRFFLLLLFFILFSTTGLHAQVPVTPPADAIVDTIEGGSTDTSIVYIIKKAPVTIKKRVEIERIKIKRYYYYTFGISAFLNTNHYKPKSGMEEYVGMINNATTAVPGYNIQIDFFSVPKTTIIGVAFIGNRFLETFNYTSTLNGSYVAKNSYMYAGIGIYTGKWYRKGEKLSFQVIAKPILNTPLGISGYSLDQNNPSETSYIVETIAYKKMYFSLITGVKLLYKTGRSYIELEPYASIAPFSMVKSSEPFSISRSAVGISLNITNEMF